MLWVKRFNHSLFSVGLESLNNNLQQGKTKAQNKIVRFSDHNTNERN